MAKLKVRRFDPGQHIKLGSTIVLLGRRGSGKSTLLADICWHLQKTGKVDYAIGMSPTEGSTSSMSKYILPSFIYNEYREDVVDRLMEKQKQQWRKGKGKECVLVLDDIAYDKKVFNTITLRQLFMNGRHRHITCILACQYSMDLPPPIRSNADVIVACRDPIKKSRHTLHEHFFGNFSDVHDFERVLNALTEDYGVMVAVQNLAPSNRITDSIFHYRARVNMPPFALASAGFKMMHMKYFRPDKDLLDDAKTRKTSRDEVSVPVAMRKIVKAGIDGKTLRTGISALTRR